MSLRLTAENAPVRKIRPATPPLRAPEAPTLPAGQSYPYSSLRGQLGLEIGIGSGLNLPFYSSQVRHVYGVDPSIELERMAAKKTSAVPFQVTFFAQSAENPIPLPDSSIDTIVMTWSLCSIPNPAAALPELKRVLNGNGRLFFIEHGRSADARVKVWQDRITRLWKRIGGGCHLNRKVDDLINAAGFHIIEQKNFYLPGPRPLTYTYQGVARGKLEQLIFGQLVCRWDSSDRSPFSSRAYVDLSDLCPKTCHEKFSMKRQDVMTCGIRNRVSPGVAVHIPPKIESATTSSLKSVKYS